MKIPPNTDAEDIIRKAQATATLAMKIPITAMPLIMETLRTVPRTRTQAIALTLGISSAPC